MSDQDSGIGARISSAREARYMSQSDLAEAMAGEGHSWRQTTVSRVERGQQPVRLAEAPAIAKLLHVSLDYLAGESAGA